MINTEILAKSNKTQPLTLISIDFDNLVNNNLPILENYLHKYFNLQNGDSSKPLVFEDCRIGINRNTNIIIKSFDDIGYDDDTFGYNNTIRILKGNMTYFEWAHKILDHYCIWLQKKYKKQSHMSVDEINYLLSTDTGIAQALFDTDSYIDWIVSQLDSIHGNLNYKFIQYADLPLFIKKVLVQLNSIKSINSSTLANLIDIMNEDVSLYYNDTYTYRILLNQLCTLLLQQGNDKIVVNNDALVSYQLPIEILYENQLSSKTTEPITTELPINGVCDVNINNIYACNNDYEKSSIKNNLLYIKLTLKQPNSIDLFITKLLLEMQRDNFCLKDFKEMLRYFKVPKIELHNYQKVLDTIMLKQAEHYHINKIYKTKMHYIFNLLFTDNAHSNKIRKVVR